VRAVAWERHHWDAPVRHGREVALLVVIRIRDVRRKAAEGSVQGGLLSLHAGGAEGRRVGNLGGGGRSWAGEGRYRGAAL
jgi:hypothetical protein